MEGITIRNYEPSDLERVKEIHEASKIDYVLPNFSSPLFLVTKVMLVDGVIRMLGGGYLQAEVYLVADPEWDEPARKLEAIQELDRVVMEELWLQGIDQACLWLPPNMDRFGKRLIEDLNFQRDRDGWLTYSKPTKCA